ncbi:MAG: helicase-related protein [Nocardioidaceae bacterium]
MITAQRPDLAPVLASLKDFQRATVEHVHQRLWVDADHVRSFLVADEVGLGKTMVAKGVISKTIDYLWDDIERIDVVYICSNTQIARQNLSRLNVAGGKSHSHADRLTMLPSVVRQFAGERINFVSFTPGTSFNVGDSGGKAGERVLLYWLLAKCWGHERVKARRWIRFFEGSVTQETFARRVANSKHELKSLDDNLAEDFGAVLNAAPGLWGGRLVDEIESCVGEFNYLRTTPSRDLSSRRFRLIGQLRALVASASVRALQPDLIIMDEFQRFKDLLDGDNDGARLARALLDEEGARTLLLSATPYKMYTLPDEPEGDDHYRDFTRTVRFLAGDEGAHVVESSLRTMRDALVSGGSLDAARAAKHKVEHELRRVMSRVERLTSTPDRDGMLREVPLEGVRLTPDDVRGYRSFDDIARLVGRQDIFEFWRSTPYPLNVMDRDSYLVKTKFQAAIDKQDSDLRDALQRAKGMLPWHEIEEYGEIDPGNAKMRGLVTDVLDRGAWRLAWLPPSLPYYELGGDYGDPALRAFTKRLVFSAWSVVPKAIAVVMSYEAERRAVDAAGGSQPAYSQRTFTAPLTYRMDGTRAASMPVFALVYPSPTLAQAADPWEVARALGHGFPALQADVLAEVRRRITGLLEQLPEGHSDESQRVDERWYWAAGILLDRMLAEESQGELEAMSGEWARWDVNERQSRLADHVAVALEIDADSLGRRPADLVEVLSLLALAGPANCSLRALGRVCGGESKWTDPQLRDWAFAMATALRSLFNRPEMVTLLRGLVEADDSYWRLVLSHSFDGGLQAVLDEYMHVMVEFEGLQDIHGHERAEQLASTVEQALAVKTASNTVERYGVLAGTITHEEHRMRTHFAARFGRAQADDQTVMRESAIRAAYNSPFWPFVLASTSVGQEGLDFHTYSHAIVHWNLPGNPVDLEQREGRVHRYKGHAVRKNIALMHSDAAFHATVDDPWYGMFLAAAEQRPSGENELVPFWVYSPAGGSSIERYVPSLPLSKEEQRYARLLRTLGAYRLVFGQPRQDDLLRYLGDKVEDLSWLRIDLSPSSERTRHVE